MEAAPKPELFSDINRYDDYGYWFEEFISIFAESKDELVDAVILNSHEFLFRFAAPDEGNINSSSFDANPYGQSYRYVRGADGTFHRVNSADKVRYVRASMEKGGGHPLKYLATEVIARSTGYAVAHFAPPFLEFDRQRKLALWKDDSQEKVLRLLESQLWSLTKAVLANGGEVEVGRDIRKTVEVLHTLHRESRSYFNNCPRLRIDIDRRTVTV